MECTDPIYNTQFVSGWPKFLAGLATSKKPARTTFQLLKHRPSDDTSTGLSLVLCKPSTGRTHQIRKHLAALGHPIANDSVYNSPLFTEFTRAVANLPADPAAADYESKLGQVKAAFTQLQSMVGSNLKAAQLAQASAPACAVCGDPQYRDPPEKDLLIYLHAWKYKQGEDVEYETSVPDWANF